MDSEDHIYVGDCTFGRIRKIDAHTGIITTIAGVGIPGYSGDGGPAIHARIGAPTAIRFDSAGNLYFADRANHVVCRIDRNGIITTVVGCGEAGFSLDGVSALAARIDMPYGLTIAFDGRLYFADSRNSRVRRVNRDGKLETVAGCTAVGDTEDGELATLAKLNEPHGLTWWGKDMLLISDHYNNRVKVVRVG